MRLDDHPRLRALLPEGRLLPDDVWRRRHALIVRVALVQAVLVGGLGLLRGQHPLVALVEVAAVALPLAVAGLQAPREGRWILAAAATLSVMAGCAVFVYVLDGLTEAHFLFFVMVGLVSLYQHWAPFGVALLVVVVHHGLLGAVLPHAVFGHDAAQASPWLWAGLHAVFVLAASAVHLAAWRLTSSRG